MNCRKDGLWCESSLNYHFTAIVPMIYLAEALRNTGHSEDLYKTTTAGGLPHRATPPGYPAGPPHRATPLGHPTAGW